MFQRKNSQTLRATFGDNITSPNWLFERSVKDFPDLLSDWMAFEKCSDSPQRFLAVTGLADKVDPQEYEDVYLGRKTPSRHLATILAQSLPGQVLRPTEPRVPGIGFYLFQSAADYWRKSHSKLPISEISESKWADIRMQILNKMAHHTTSPALELEEEDTAIPNGADNDLYEALAKVASKAGKNTDELIEIISEHYADSPLSTLQTVSSLLAEQGLDFSDDQLKEFIAEQTKAQVKNYSGSAQALRFLRQNRNLTSRQLGVTGHYVLGCENLQRGPFFPYLSMIVEHLGLSIEEAQCFIQMAEPKLSEKVGPDWLREKIVARDWKALASPALDPEWLKHQDKDKQAGLLLRDYRKRLNKSRSDIGTSIGNPKVLHAWETGSSVINPSRLGVLIKSLELSVDEAEKFALLVRPDLTEKTGPQWLHDKIIAKDWEHISFPALDPEWLDAQDAHKQAPLWMYDYIERAGKYHNDIAQAAGINKSTFSAWECFKSAIDVQKLGALLEHMDCTLEEATRFAQLVNPRLTKNIDVSWLQEKIVAKEWDYISNPVLDDKWLSMQEPNKQAGLLLNYYRERTGKFQVHVGEKLGVTQSCMGIWERGRSPIDPTKLEILCGELALSEEETVHFVSHLPHLANPPVEWVKKQVSEKRWDVIVSPGLDQTWLNLQEPFKRAGFLLQAYRSRLGKLPFETSHDLGVCTGDYAGWEHGSRAIFWNKIPTIIDKMNLTPDEAGDFEAIVVISNQAILARNKAMKGAKVQVGSSLLAEDTPELLLKNQKRHGRE